MSAPLGRAGVAAVSFGGRGGGLAYVARLVRAVCATRQGSEPWTGAPEPAPDGVGQAHPSIGRVLACPLGLLDHDPATEGLDSGPAGLPGEIPGGVSLSPDLREIGPSSVLILGRMHDEERDKGHDELLESWPAVVARVPGAQLVVAGLGNDVPRLQAKARALGVGHCVVFCGFLPRATLTALMGRIAVFAMPSAREGFGLVYLEAMRAGRPCIGSTSDAAGGIMVQGE